MLPDLTINDHGAFTAQRVAAILSCELFSVFQVASIKINNWNIDRCGNMAFAIQFPRTNIDNRNTPYLRSDELCVDNLCCHHYLFSAS